MSDTTQHPSSSLHPICSSATLRIDQEHCPKCDWPGIYIRRRYFETMYSDVWMCNNDACKMSGLYWHRDFQHAPKSQTNDQDQ
jgi:hypothetical protein